MERDLFRKYSSFSFQIRKNNNQTISGGKRQGKVYGTVTPEFGSIKLSATENNTRPNLPRQTFL